MEYLLVGGWAVSHHGYVRSTADMDVWIASNQDNAFRVTNALRQFGFDVSQQTTEVFLEPERIIRMGVPPFRIEILTSVSGVQFAECYSNRVVESIDGVDVAFIGLSDLKANKKASGRLKDLADLEHLP